MRINKRRMNKRRRRRRVKNISRESGRWKNRFRNREMKNREGCM